MLTVKIILLGNTFVGKSCLLDCYRRNTSLSELDQKLPHHENRYLTTIGVDFTSKTETYQNDTFKLQIWDTSGHERFRSLTNSYFRGSNIAIILCSSRHRKSLDGMKVWYQAFQNQNAEKNTIVYFVLNNYKDDLTIPSSDGTVSLEDVQLLADQIDPSIRVMSISCWDGSGIQRLFKESGYQYFQIIKDSDRAEENPITESTTLESAQKMLSRNIEDVQKRCESCLIS